MKKFFIAQIVGCVELLDSTTDKESQKLVTKNKIKTLLEGNRGLELKVVNVAFVIDEQNYSKEEKQGG